MLRLLREVGAGASNRCIPLRAAKNIILAGMRSVTIHDKQVAKKTDLSAQFYLTEEDVGKNRAEACKDKLQELNTSVQVLASAADLTDAFLTQFQVFLCDPCQCWPACVSLCLCLSITCRAPIT